MKLKRLWLQGIRLGYRFGYQVNRDFDDPRSPGAPRIAPGYLTIAHTIAKRRYDDGLSVTDATEVVMKELGIKSKSTISNRKNELYLQTGSRPKSIKQICDEYSEKFKN